MKNKNTSVLVSVALAALIVALGMADVMAAPIEFIHKGNGSGSIGTINFSNANFTVTGIGDTNNRGTYILGVFQGFFIDYNSSSISIDGVGTFDFITGLETFVNQVNSLALLTRTGNGADSFSGPTNSAFHTWDMLSSIGPITGTGQLFNWSAFPQIMTNAGELVFNDGSSPVTFQAIVPEPCSLVLAAFGFAGLADWGWRRRKQSHA